MSSITSGPRFFRPTSNDKILNAIRNRASSDYQRRIPAATKQNIQDVVRRLEDNRPDWNEFHQALVNRVGLEIFRTNSFTNRLAKFKGPELRSGDTIEEIAVGFAQAYTYDADRDYLERAIFGQERADVRAAYHKINRQNFYKITINDAMLRRAFDTEGGLSKFIQELVQVPSNSDQYDEFLAMAGLFREYHDAGGFYKVTVPDISDPDSTEAEAKTFLRIVREFAEILQFPSAHYNAAGLESVHADPDDLELFLTPQAQAAIDVNALAAAFNIDSANIAARTTIIPPEHFRIPGVQGVLSTKHFFVASDSLFEVTEERNPVGLYTNNFLHHHSVISTSTFVPAILLWTGAGDTITITETPVTDVPEVTALDSTGEPVDELERGQAYHLEAVAVTEGDNDATRLTITGLISPRSTYWPQNQTLWISPDEVSESVTVRATATDDNTKYEETVFPIEGEIANLWPNPSVTADVPTP